MSKTYKLAIIGFGNVGQGLAQILEEKSAFLLEKFGFDISIVAICDLLKGSIADSNGLHPGGLLKHMSENGDLMQFDAPISGWTVEEMIANSGANILVELAYTDLITGEPALSHVKLAIQQGMHVSMTNKGPVALHYPQIRKLAAEHNVYVGIEGTVMSGTPVVGLGSDMLLAAGINKIQGILNGTSNYILCEMESGVGYHDALSRAQELGYAEADPSGDVEGFDAAAKAVILGNLFMGLPITINDVSRVGIAHLSSDDLLVAKASNKRWKLIAIVEKVGEEVNVSVKPEMLASDHPLAAISGATNAITYSTDTLGDITLVGPGAGRIETGYAVIEDILSIHRRA